MKNKKINFIFIIFLLTFLFNSLILINSKNDHIHAEGNKLIYQDKVVVLKGVSIADPFELETKDNRFSEYMFEELSNWNINCVRIPIHPGNWLVRKDYCERYLDKIIKWAEKYDFYIVLDWHAIGNPLTGAPQQPKWMIKDNPVYESSQKTAFKAWKTLSKRYGKNPKVIFELFNEPASVDGIAPDWKDWQKYLHKLIDTVRRNAPDTLVLVSGWQWTLDLTGFKDYPIKKDNVAYVSHVYASHEEWDTFIGFMLDKYPVVITEWGFSPDVKEGSHYYGDREGFGQEFYRYLLKNELSWMAWCFHATWLPNMLLGWSYNPSEEGKLIKQILLEDKEKPSLTISEPADGAVLKETALISGTASDNNSILYVEIKIGDKIFKPENNYSKDYDSNKWSLNWDTLKMKNGDYKIEVEAMDTGGNLISKSFNVKLDNYIDDVPPVIEIKKFDKSKKLKGIINITGKITDNDKLNEINVIMDKKIKLPNNYISYVILKKWYGSGEIRAKENAIGIYYDITFDKDGNFSALVDTSKLSNGNHSVIFEAADIRGNTNSVSVQINIDNGNVLSDCENKNSWDSYKGGGSKSERKQDKGVKGNSIKGVYVGTNTGWWGIRSYLLKDLSEYKGIEFHLKGTSNKIRLQITDQEKKLFIYQIIPTAEWKTYKIPFKDFSFRGDFQNAGIPNTQVQKLKEVYEFQIMHDIENQDADGEFWVDEITLYK